MVLSFYKNCSSMDTFPSSCIIYLFTIPQTALFLLLYLRHVFSNSLGKSSTPNQSLICPPFTTWIEVLSFKIETFSTIVYTFIFETTYFLIEEVVFCTIQHYFHKSHCHLRMYEHNNTYQFDQRRIDYLIAQEQLLWYIFLFLTHFTSSIIQNSGWIVRSIFGSNLNRLSSFLLQHNIKFMLPCQSPIQYSYPWSLQYLIQFDVL